MMDEGDSRGPEGPSGTRHFVVIGGGISGLTAAERLVASAADARVTLLEASDRLGGAIQTERTDGFVIEHGPDVMLSSKPAARLLCERLGIADRLHGTNPAVRGAYILRDGELRRLPAGWSGLVPAKLGPVAASGLLSPWGLARLALEPLRPARRDDGDESVERFAVRRLGREAWDRLTEPMLSGIYGGDGSALSVEATLPQLRQLEREHGSLLRGLRRAAATTSRAHPPFVALPGGNHELIEALERRLLSTGRVTIRHSAPARSVAAAPGGAVVRLEDGSALEATGLVLAVPAHVVARLVAAADPALAAETGAIPYASTAIVSFAFDTADIPRPLDATGYVVPKVEGRAALACTFSSSKFLGRAPEGRALLRVFLGGARRPQLAREDDDTLLGLARGELREILGVTAEPRLARVTRWLDAMPQYQLGHRERVARIFALAARHPWLALAGNAYDGVGIPDAIRAAERAAAALLASAPAAPIPTATAA